jgi:two-component system NarL family sensor kinase
MQDSIIQSAIIITIIFVVFLSVLILFIFRHFKKEKENEREIFRAVIKAQEEERQIISSNIHDDLGALLTSARISIDNIISEAIPEQINQLKHLADVVSQASKSAKSASNALTPNTVSKYGLKGAINDLPSIFRYADVNIEVSYAIQKELDSFVQISIYRIIYEIVNNSVKYSSAKNIYISIKEDQKNIIQIEAGDNGKGFLTEDILESSNGIKNIKNRVNLLNGKISIESSKGNGCKYLITI